MSHPAIAPGQVAVVTGAALGIGRALSERFLKEGMRVAMLDVDGERLTAVQQALGGDSTAIVCDVSDRAALEDARAAITEKWAAPSVLVNNAVTRMGRGLDAPLDEWQRALEINVMGVVNGVRTFLPGMTGAGLIVNAGSKQGITNPPAHPVYNMAKSAVKTYTECLEHDLRQRPGRPVTAHLLVPGWTTTGTAEHKPGAWLPEQVVDYMMAAIGRDSFYIICPDDETSEAQDKARIQWAAGDITEDRPPLSRWHPDWADAFKAVEP